MRKRRTNKRREPAWKVRRPASKHGRIVKQLAAEGLSGDYIAATIGTSRDGLRARHAIELHEGREIWSAEKPKQRLTKAERIEKELLERIERSFDSAWFTKSHGNLLYGGTYSVDEALAWCRSFKK